MLNSTSGEMQTANRNGLHIAFDAQWYSTGPPSGCAVVRSLLPELIASRPPEDKFTLLVRRGDDLDGLARGLNSRVRLLEVPPLTVLGTNTIAVPFLLRHSGVDVLISQNFSPPWGRFNTVTLIYDLIHIRRPDLFTVLERIYLSPLRRLARRASRICTISEHEKGEMVRCGFAALKSVSVIPLAPRPAFLNASADAVRQAQLAYGLPERYVLYVGRLTSRKNLTTLLRAAAASKAVSEDCPIVLAGRRDRKTDDIKDLMTNLGKRVRVLGFVPEELLPGLVTGASLLAFVSLDEGFGLPPLEAISCGTPTLVSDLEVMHEVLGDAAVYVDPLSVDAVSVALDRMLAADYDSDVARSHRQRRASGFTWANSAAALSEAIDLVQDGGWGGSVVEDRRGGR